ncbi:hypothetical protein [Halococcus thailandensis]|nr:hypothetical protein [Halococcus thailandensis]
MSTDTSTNHRSSLYSTLDPRTQRAIDEPMTVITRGPGTYHIESASGATYIVHFPPESSSTENGSPTCNCPDQTTPPSETDCKHLQRVKLDIACGEVAHPNDWPSDAELAEREPARPTDTSPPMPSPVATDGGQALGTAPSSTSTGASPEIATEEPTVIDERPGEIELDAPRDICHRISERITEIEFEIEQRRGELKDLETALSILEDLVPELDGSELEK